MTQSKRLLKDLIAAFSLANLCYLPWWVEYLYQEYTTQYYYQPSKQLVDAAYLKGLLLAVPTIALLIFIGIRTARKTTRPGTKALMGCCALFFLLLFVNGLRLGFGLTKHSILTTLGIPETVIACALVLGALTYLLTAQTQRFFSVCYHLILIASPFALVNYVQAIQKINAINKMETEQVKLAPTLLMNQEERPRVLWMIFDELDIRLAFEKRPESISLKELDRFKNQAFFASQAYAAGTATATSIPSLITGTFVKSVQVKGPFKLELAFANSKPNELWGDVPNVFSKAYRRGFNTGVVGYYHPYQRVLGKYLTQCAEGCHPGISTRKSGARIYLELLALWKGLPFMQKKGKAMSTIQIEKRRKIHLDTYKYLLRNAQNMISKPELGFVFIHWSIPHLPSIYNPSALDLSYNHTSAIDPYLENLLLVDVTLAKVRDQLEKEGLWDKTTIIITSDHHLRKNHWSPEKVFSVTTDIWEQLDERDTRVPFMVKFAHHDEPSVYQEPLNTILLPDIIQRLLMGEIENSQDLTTWLEWQDPNRKIPHTEAR